ncbi:MAG: fimbria/pilus periplasmic chaperone [Methylotenera sp.]
MNQVQNSCLHLKTFLISGVIGLLAASLITPAWAGVFSVTPVRIYMTPKDRAVAVTITNDGDTELIMQADLYQWKQKPDGQDELTLTEDMFLAPPIIKMAPKSRQVVRLARLSPAKSSEQLTY